MKTSIQKSLGSLLKKVWDFYIEEYKKVMLITGIFILILLSPLIFSKIKRGYFLDFDYSIKGGTLISIKTGGAVNLNEINKELPKYLEDFTVRERKDKITGEIIGYDVITSRKIGKEKAKLISDLFGGKEFSILYQSPALGREFFIQATFILLFSIFLMGGFVYYYFRNLASTLSIMFTTTMDLLLTISFMSLLDIKLSIASFGALLMILGYSVDSDVLLSTMIIKRRGNIKERVWFAFKVEFVMNSAAFLAFLVMMIFSHVEIIRKIAEVLFLGLIFDFITTWGFGYSLQRMLVMKE